MADCELIEQCGFFRKYGATLSLACKGFIALYCRGPAMDDCFRKAYRMAHGEPPDDDVMPNGELVPEGHRL
ncbi:MAG TPA: hypothetical protein VGF40_06405 [Thermoanaerobaculia bacterium]